MTAQDSREDEHDERRDDDDRGRDRKITIIVNGQAKTVRDKEISYIEVVNLAYDNDPPTGENVLITVAYRKGPNGKTGTLTPGDTVKVKEGMVFDVRATDKS